MDIKRIDSYDDSRFSQRALDQHGAYTVDGQSYEIEITGPISAVVRGKDAAVYGALIEEFRFHAPHIVKLSDESGRTVAVYPPCEVFDIALEDIQPSQFFVDEDKLKAVKTFIRGAEDIVVQVTPYKGRFVSLDGHTRLYLAVKEGFAAVKAVISETDDSIWPFVREAERRRIFAPGDMTLLPHEEYEILWNRYCDEVFEALEKQKTRETQV